ncbi:putative peptidase family-domain-containing protein [Podospora australis]|uniref:Peptidase family-domain-containing protein n=1 Tax=Podospora australis TaxID=1536484 RepID=A0AAN6WIB8_9PEZI|nr:putative peptidase family-domain-containing protein [Podospora australis]
MFQIDNFKLDEVEEVYQRCLIITGKCTDDYVSVNVDDSVVVEPRKNDHVVVKITDSFNQPSFPDQKWPYSRGYFKALLMLSPGINTVTISMASDSTISKTFSIRYTPLLHKPPLHLAILVAKDSPLLIDCPPSKHGGVSSAHSGLEAAIAKFRTTAYMWQALTAEDMRGLGLGRRSFRLEEVWSTNSLTKESLNSTKDPRKVLGLVPKVHVVRTNKTVAQLRATGTSPEQPGPDIHKIFLSALESYGGPFSSDTAPVIAGLILDSQYDEIKGRVLADNMSFRIPRYNPKGISLGMFGSHLAYAWPRFIEELPDCLLDTTDPGNTVMVEEYPSGEALMWEACATGQTSFLRQVGAAFGLEETENGSIMHRQYPPDWAQAFLPVVPQTKNGYHPQEKGIPGTKQHECHWALSDALILHNFKQRHFSLPGDVPLPDVAPTVKGIQESDGSMTLEIRCEAGLAQVSVGGNGYHNLDEDTSIANPAKGLRYRIEELKEKIGGSDVTWLNVTGMSGRTLMVFQEKLEKILTPRGRDAPLLVPNYRDGKKLRLLRQSIANPGNAEDEITSDDENSDGSGSDSARDRKRKRKQREDLWHWTVLLKKPDSKGNLVDAHKIDIRVGAHLDGAVVYYKDGTKVPCGPRGKRGEPDPSMGGHQARKILLPKGVEIVKVAAHTEPANHINATLRGLRIWLSNGQAIGALNLHETEGQVEYMEPPPTHKVIGFYGTSNGQWNGVRKFGIITAPRDMNPEDLETVYRMPEFRNNPRGPWISAEKELEPEMAQDKAEVSDHYPEDWEDSDYDDEWDSEAERIYQRAPKKVKRDEGQEME